MSTVPATASPSSVSTSWPDELETRHIAEMLPHGPKARYIDSAVINRSGQTPSITANRRVRLSDCNGGDHFPGQPVFPGHLWQEIAFQACGLLMAHRAGHRIDGHAYSVNYATKRVAIPGDRLRVVIELTEVKISRVTFKATGYANDILAFESVQTAVLPRKSPSVAT